MARIQEGRGKKYPKHPDWCDHLAKHRVSGVRQELLHCDHCGVLLLVEDGELVEVQPTLKI